MSEAFTITVEGQSNKALADLYKDRLPAGLHESIAKAAADVFRTHFKELDQTRANDLGGKRSHFYWNASQSVQGIPTADGAEVVINHLGLRQRWLGGTIYPVNARKLAIPARAESYGIPPKDFPGDLVVITFRSGAMALVKDEQTHTTDQFGNYLIKSSAKGQRKSRKRTIGLVEYWLVDQVTQDPDPDVMPSPEDILNAVTEATEEFIQEMTQ